MKHLVALVTLSAILLLTVSAAFAGPAGDEWDEHDSGAAVLYLPNAVDGQADIITQARERVEEMEL